MRPSRRVRWSAICGGVLAVLAAVPAWSQTQYEDARRFLDFSPEPLARSPRMVGMGRLSLVANDAHSRISMWSFAGNPTGVLEDDSVSTLEIAPGTSSAVSLQDVPGFTPTPERQDLGAREVRVQYEAWRRASGETAYGFMGDLGFLRFDRPVNESIEQRSVYTQPRLMSLINGKMPFLLKDRMQYALRVLYGYQALDERYLTYVDNAAGSYLDQSGQTVDPPDFFTPDRLGVRSIGVGLATSFRIAEPLTLAAAFDHVSNAIRGVNEGFRYASENTENRPYENLQLSAIGRVGKNLEYGADWRTWTSSSAARWVFTVSAGVGATPLVDRGKLYDREEDGSSLRSRARWLAGPFEVGAGINLGRRTIGIGRPEGSDYEDSFNKFLNQLSERTGADSLVLPDSVRTHETEETGWEAGGGVAWHLPNRRGVVGFEFRNGEQKLERSLSGEGPRRTGWDARVGLEYLATPILALRTGYIHRSDDRDDLTERNEYLSHAVTFGAGLRPSGSKWSFESGYVFEWSEADFPDPGRPRGNRQQLESRILWSF